MGLEFDDVPVPVGSLPSQSSSCFRRRRCRWARPF